MKNKKRREVIVWTGAPLSKEERKNYSKEHPNERLSLFLRFPWIRWVLPVVALVFSIITLAIK